MSLSIIRERTLELHRLAHGLARYNHRVERKELPPCGIYLFFEQGEEVEAGDRRLDRIVRVGTHNQDGNFPGRIRTHYGNRGRLGGNKNSSVFRKHLGGALMRRENPEDVRLAPWLKQDGPSFEELEVEVSRTLHERFTFVCFAVATKEERLRLESGLIALLAQHPAGPPSAQWLGHHANAPEIRRTGLWNTRCVDSAPLADADWDQLRELMHDR